MEGAVEDKRMGKRVVRFGETGPALELWQQVISPYLQDNVLWSDVERTAAYRSLPVGSLPTFGGKIGVVDKVKRTLPFSSKTALMPSTYR